VTIKRKRPGQYPYDHRAAIPSPPRPTPKALKELEKMQDEAGSGIVVEPREPGADDECSSDSGS
jgi:hypothetical protein